MWDDSGVGGGDKGKRESASSSSLDSAMIKPKYHFDRRFCLCLSIRPTQIAVSALPSFLSKIRSETVSLRGGTIPEESRFTIPVFVESCH